MYKIYASNLCPPSVRIHFLPCCLARWIGDMGLTLVKPFLGDTHPPSSKFRPLAFVICGEEAPFLIFLPTMGVFSFTGESKSKARTLNGLAGLTLLGVICLALLGDCSKSGLILMWGAGELTSTSLRGDNGTLIGEASNGFFIGDFSGLARYWLADVTFPFIRLVGEQCWFSMSSSVWKKHAQVGSEHGFYYFIYNFLVL